MEDTQLHAYDVALSMIVSAYHREQGSPVPIEPILVGDIITILVGFCAGMLRQQTEGDERRFAAWLAERLEAAPR